jgi:multiple sugar transport system substrate-binding protein
MKSEKGSMMKVLRNRRAQRVVAAVVSLAAVGSLAACGGSTDSSSSDDNTLTISYWDDQMETIKEFIKENPDIKVKEIRVPGDDYNTKLNQMVVGNETPDVMLVQEADYVRFAENGVLEKLDDKLSDLGVDKGDFQPAVKDISDQVDGYYGFPQGFATEIMYYNKDMFDAAGLEYPNNDWTWDDYAAAAQKLTKSDGSQYGSDSPTFNGVWYSLIGTTGDKIVKDGKLSFGSGLKKTLEFQNKMVNELKAQPEPASGSKVTDLFAAGKAGMTLGGTWLLSTYKDVDFNWDIATMPVADGGSDYNSLHTSFWTISSQSKHKTAAEKLIKYLMSKQGQKVMSQSLGNMPAFQSMMADGYYKVQGAKGPSNWDALTSAAQEAKFGYTLVNSTATFNLYDQFNAYVLGQTTLNDVVTTQVDKANKEITDAQ